MNFDIFTIKEKQSTTIVEANEINAIKQLDIERTGVRRFKDGKVFQTSRLGQATKERLIQDTYDWGGPGTPHDFGFAPAKTETRKGLLPSTNLKEQFLQALDTLKSQNPDFIFGGRCNSIEFDISLTSSYGLDLSSSGGNFDWYLTYQRKGSGNMIDGWLADSARDSHVSQVLEDHRPYLKAQGKVLQLKSGKMPVLLVEPTLPLKKLTESFQISKYQEGAAFYSGKLGSKIFNEKVNIVDAGYDPDFGLFQFFDGEGIVRAESLPLIEDGIFKSLISDLRFGKKFGAASTGNGLRAYNRGVSLAPKGLRFVGGTKSWIDIVKQFDRCLVGLLAAGGDSNDLGEYSSPIQIGYILERGEVIGQAPQVTVKTSVDKYLGSDLIDISRDGWTPLSPSGCVISEMEVLVN